MKHITIGFSKPNKILPLFSWAIRAYEGIPFSHVYIRWQTSLGPSICYHAAHTSLHFLSDRMFEKEIIPIESFEFDVSEEQFERMLKYCLETCGQKYALLGALGVPLVHLFKLQKNPFGDGESEQYCAELVIRSIGQMSGEKLTFDADRVTLKEVYNFVKDKHVQGGTL